MKPMAERLDGLRMALGTDWGGLADRLGISRSMLGFLRSGERNASPKLIKRISDTEEPTTADLRKRAAELTERLDLLKTIRNAEEMVELIDAAFAAKNDERIHPMSAEPKEKTSPPAVFRRVRFPGICAFANTYGYHYTSVYKCLTGQRPSVTMLIKWREWQAGKEAKPRISVAK